MQNKTMLPPDAEKAMRVIRMEVYKSLIFPLSMFLFFGGATFMIHAALAETANGTVGDLSKIQSETLLIKAKVSKATAQSELDRSGGTAVASSGTSDDMPVVKKVYGVGGKMAATFLYSNGAAIEGKVGDTIIGGFKVVSITIDKVELLKGKTVVTAGFSTTPPVQQTPSVTSPPLSFPVVR